MFYSLVFLIISKSFKEFHGLSKFFYGSFFLKTPWRGVLLLVCFLLVLETWPDRCLPPAKVNRGEKSKSAQVKSTPPGQTPRAWLLFHSVDVPVGGYGQQRNLLIGAQNDAWSTGGLCPLVALPEIKT